MAEGGESLELLCTQYEATPRDTLLSLQDVGATRDQYATADARNQRQTDQRLEAYRYSSLLDLTDTPEDSVSLRHGVLRLVVMGLIGAGKSATSNTLLQRRAFHDSSSANPVTTTTMMHSAEIGGRLVEVVDTAGAWRSPKDVYSPNDNELYVFVVNLSSPRFDVQQLEKLRKMKDSRGRPLLKHRLCLLLLTHADDALRTENLTEYVHAVRGDPLHELVTGDLQGWRVLAVNNQPETEYERTQRDEQIWRLVEATNMAALRGQPGVRCTPVKVIGPLLGVIVMVVVIALLVKYL